jgi:branched-chain amino acid transport system permease protein
MSSWLRKNRTRLIIIGVLLFLLFSASQGMTTQEWVITALRGLATGAIIFLVAAGLSLIFGLMDVLNLAHGELFMLGAYIGWTVLVRPDTFVDLLTPALLLGAAFLAAPLWERTLGGVAWSGGIGRFLPWLLLVAGGAITWRMLRDYPVTRWDAQQFAQSPGTWSLAAQQGTLRLPEPLGFSGLPAAVVIGGIILGGMLLALAVSAFRRRGRPGRQIVTFSRPRLIGTLALYGVGLAVLLTNDRLTAALAGMGSNALFVLALLVAAVTGFVLGWFVESTLVRPLYDRPIYQIMLTLGIGFILIEVVRYTWGRPEFTMPKPALFSAAGGPCPATSIGDALANNCSTMLFLGGRIRTYNELFIIAVGAVVLLAIWLLLQRTRLGMIIRAGVQDPEMVQALGINVRQVFTFVFALGVGLAAFGGVLAAPSVGLSTMMGAQFLLLALIAMAIGGLTSFPGSAAGALLVGLVQQFMIKYSQTGIQLPFLAEPFKPTPPLVPASVVLLMVVILLFLPHGLFGRNE